MTHSEFRKLDWKFIYHISMMSEHITRHQATFNGSIITWDEVQPMRNDEPYGILKIYITYKGTEYKSIESFIKAMEETRCQG